MYNHKQPAQFLQVLKNEHPQAFKFNFIYYSQIKTHGMMDERKECIPWILAFMIFGSFTFILAELFSNYAPQWNTIRYFILANLSTLLFFMLICPIILKQMKHSSTSLYQERNTTPFKLTALIILQSLNFAFAESWFMFVLITFFSFSFGFVKFYRENLFLEKTTLEQYLYLQDIRRACFWSYKQSLIIYFKLLFKTPKNPQYDTLIQRKKQLAELHTKLIQFENKLCLIYKHADIEAYLDSIS